MKNMVPKLAILAALMILAAPLTAQPMDSGHFGGHGQCPPDCPNREKMEANYENLRTLKLLEALELSEDQSNKFMPELSRHRKTMRDLREGHRATLDSLKALLGSSGSDADLDSIYSMIRANRVEAQQERDRFFDFSKQNLSKKQFGKLLLFEERFERDILESLREFRSQHSGFRGRP